MKRTTLLIVTLAVLAIGVGPWLWNNVISPRPMLDMEPLKYSEDSSWAALPVQTPEAVWSGGWGVDVFIISEDSALSGRNQKDLERRERQARKQAQSLKSAMQVIGPVYAPLYRDNATNDDITRAFETYLRSDNHGRAIVLVHDMPIAPSILLRLEQDPDLKARFGGFLSISDARDGIPPIEAGTEPMAEGEASNYCSDRLNEANSCQMIVPAHKAKGLWVLTTEGMPGGEMIAEFPAWLEDNVAKKAEPLGDFEEVEIVEIRRPGDTDENRQDGDGN